MALGGAGSTSLRKRNVLTLSNNTRNGINGKGNGVLYQDDRTKPVHNKRGRVSTLLILLDYMFHAAAVIFVAYGFFLRSKFHNGDECEMTYSMLNYVPIKSPPSAHYQLYKFVDSRDARNKGILRAKIQILDTSHCTVNPSIVIYIPGHWGSYTQCRSLGAHGTQFTRNTHSRDYVNKAYQSLAEGTWSGVAPIEKNFVFDTYCIDFAEQGAGIHGNFIRKQADFVARVVEKLTLECSASDVTLVGHSIGGLVAKSVPILHPLVIDRIRTIITLATPHQRNPYTFDESMKEIYQAYEFLDSSILVASISGGLKDELIPPSLCEIENNMSRVGGKVYGMDHKAIVWCHQILEVVRKAIFILSHRNETIGNRMSLMREAGIIDEGYKSHVAEQKKKFSDNFGLIQWIALECSMIYNAELLLATLSLFCAFNLIWPNAKPLFVSLIVALIARYFSNHELHSISHLILSFLSSAITMIVKTVFLQLPFKSRKDVSTFCGCTMSACVVTFIVFAACSLAIIVIQTLKQKTIRIQACSTIMFSIMIWTLTTSLRLRSIDNRTAIFVSWNFIAMPVLTFGKATVFCWGVLDDYGDIDPGFVIKIAIPVAFRILIGRASKAQCCSEHIAFSVAHMIHLHFYLSILFKVGEGYIVGYFLAGASIIEAIRLLV